MLDKYKKLKSRRRVSFHLGACALLFLICAIIAKELVTCIVLGVLLLICLILYINSFERMNNIENILISTCIQCNKNINIKKETKYLLYGQNVSKSDFDTTIANEKRKIEIKKYYCDECKLCFSIIEIYQMNNKGTYSRVKKEKYLIEDYNENS